MRLRLLTSWLAAAVLVVFACTTDTAIGPTRVDSLAVTPAEDTLVVSDLLQLHAVAFDPRGMSFVGPGATWTTSNPAVATVSAVGQVTAVATGSATIQATLSGKSAVAHVLVTPPPSFPAGTDTVLFVGIANAPSPPAARTVAIANTAGGTLTGITIDSIQYVVGTPGWLTASLSSPTAPDTLRLQPGTTALTPGSHSAFVFLSAPKAGNSPKKVMAIFTVGVGAAASIAADSGDGQTAAVNTVVTIKPTVIVRDQFNNPVGGAAVTFAVTGGGGTVNPTTPVTTDVNGRARVTAWTLGTSVGGNTLQATSGSLTGSPVSFSATAVAGAASLIAKNGGDAQSATVNTTVVTPPSVKVTDAFGNPVAGVTVTFAVASGGGSVTGATAVSNAAGIATVGSWKLGTTAGANTLTATSGSLGGSPLTFTATAVADAASTIVMNGGDAQTATVNSAVLTGPSVKVVDQFGNGVAGVGVTFAVASGSGTVDPTTTIFTDAQGVARVTSWTLGTAAGANSITATSGALSGSPLTFTATGTAGAAATIVKNGGDAQTATVGSVVATAPSAKVTDQFGNPVSGAAVTFAVVSGGGTVSPTTAILTTAAGVAQATSWTLGTTVGANSLTAASTGLAGSPQTFTATGTAGTPTTTAKSGGDAQSATVNTTVATAPSALVTDGNGNPVGGVTVTFTVASGGGSVTGATPITNASGIATVGSWKLGTTAGANSLTASATGTTSATFTATGTAGAASQIALNAGNAQSATVNTAVATPPSVLVRDQFNNPVAGTAVTFAVTGGGGTVNPTTAIATNASGIAQVTSWTLGTTAGTNNNTLTATSGTLTGSPVGFTASGTAGAATQIALNAGNGQSATVNTAVATPPSVLVRDQFGNPVAGTLVTFAVTAGGGTVNPTTPIATNAGGIAQVTSWSLGNATGTNNNTLTATAGGLSGSPVGFTASGTAAGASQIALNAGTGQSATVNTAVATAPSVVVRDQFGNPVAGTLVTFAVTGGGGTVNPTAAIATNASGIAQVTSWTLGTAAGTNNNTLTATSGTLTGSPVGFTASGTAGAATQIAVSAGNGQSATVNTAVVTRPSVVVRDQFGNPVAGALVTFAVTGGGGTVNPTTAIATNASGIAQVTSWTLGNAAGTSNNTLSATATGLAGSPVGFTASGTAGAATQIALNAGNAQTATVNTAVATPPSVVVRDQFGNPVAGALVTFAVTGGGGTVNPTTALATNASGIVQVTSWTLGTAAGSSNNTLSATVGAVTPVTFTASATAGTAQNIALSGGTAQTDTIGATLATALSVLVTDQFGNPKSGTTVNWAGSGGAATSGPSSVTNGSGVASISLTLGTTAGPQGATAINGALTGSPVTFSATANPGNAKNIALNGGNGQSATVNTAVATAPAVLVRDQFNNPVAGALVTFAVTGGGGTVNPTTAIATTASGIAQVTSWTLGTGAGTNNNTLSATATGLTGSPVGFTASGTPGAATTIAINAGDGQSAQVNATVPTPPSVKASDQFGNGVSGVSITFAVTRGGGAVVPIPPIPTNAAGIAQVTSWTMGSVADTNKLTATSSPALTGSPVTFTATAFAGTATQMALNAGDAQTDTIGATLAIAYSVIVRDASNNPVGGVPVTWAATGGGGSMTPATSTTNGSGIASASRILGTTAGAQTATASVGGLTGSPVGFTATANAGHATTIALNGGNAQTATVNTNVASAPSAKVTDRAGNVVAGTGVTFAVTGGGGSVNPTSAIPTNASGIAQVTSWTLGTTAGTNNNTLSATATGLTGSPVSFIASGTAGAATQIAVNAGNGQTATVNTAVATPPSAIVRDQFNNPVPSALVTFAVTAGGGSVNPTSAIATNASGIAQVTSWTLGTAVGTNNNTLSATVGAVTPATFTASATAGAAQTIALSAGNTQTDTIGATLPTPLSVLVTDQFGNPKSGVTVNWAGTGGATTSGPSSVTNSSGIATISLTLGTAAGGQGATATNVALTGSPVSFSATANPGNAKNIALNSGDAQTATVNTNVAIAPSAKVTDRAGNVVQGTGVTFAVTGGGGSVNPTSAILTNSSGIAQVTSWTVGTAAGTSNNTLSATATGLTGSPLGFTASGTAGTPTQIAVNAGNGQTATVNTAVATPPSVLVRDLFNNPVPSALVTFAVTGGGGSVNPTSAIAANGSGIAQVTSWTLGTGAGTNNNTLSATVGAVTPVGFTASATAGTAQTIALSAGNAQTDTIGATLGTPLSVLVTDQFSNPKSGTTVNWAGTGGAATSGPSSVTNGSGIATISLTLGTAAGGQGATATNVALTGSPVSFTATATAGHATQIAINAGDGQSATVNANVAIAPSAIVRDRANNVVQGTGVTFAVTGGAGSVNPTSAILTNSSGIAQVTSWTLGTAAGTNNNTLSATSAGLTGSPRTFTASANVGPVNAGTSTVAASTASITACASSCVAGTTASTITVTVRDQFNNTIQGAGVTVSSNGTNNAFAPAASGTSGVGGVFTATFSSTTAQAKTISASANAVSITQTAAVTVNHDVLSAGVSTLAVSSGTMTACSTGCVVGTTAVTVTVTAKDQFTNTISGQSVTLAATATGNTLSPASGSTDGSGVFASTYNSTLVGAHTVSATGITQTQNVTVSAAAAALITVNAGNNQTARINTAVTTAPAVLVTDAFGNAKSGVTVTFAVATGGGSVTGAAPTTTAGGIATVGSWTLQAAVAASGTGTHANTLTATATGFSGGGNPVTFTAQGIYTLSGDVQPIWTTNCVSCHGLAASAPDLRSGFSRASTVGIASTCVAGTRIVASNAAASVLYLRMTTTTTCSGAMPTTGILPAATTNIVRDWINNGAQNN